MSLTHNWKAWMKLGNQPISVILVCKIEYFQWIILPDQSWFISCYITSITCWFTESTIPVDATSWKHHSSFYTLYKAEQFAISWIVRSSTCIAAVEMLWCPGGSSNITVWFSYQNVSPEVCKKVKNWNDLHFLTVKVL